MHSCNQSFQTLSFYLTIIELSIAAALCIAITYRFGADENGVGVDGQAGPCMVW